MFGQGFNYGFLVGESCLTDTTDIFGDSSGVALWSLDYDASETGGNFDGSILGNVEFGKAGKINWGIQPQGANATDCIELPSISALPTTSNLNNFAISMWIKSNATDLNASTGSNALFVNFDGSYQYIGFGGNINGNFPTGKIFYYTYGGSGSHNNWIITPSSYANDQWHHLIVTDIYNGSTRDRKIYVDNTLIVSDSVDKNFFSGSSGPFIGGTDGNNAACKAHIDQVRIFNRDLTTAERTTLYQEATCVYTGTTQSHLFGCVANYNLDSDAKESMGVTAYDGTETNITYEFGRFGAAAKFPGLASSYITTGLTSLGSNFSLSFWFNPDFIDGSSGYRTPLGKYFSGSGNAELLLTFQDNGNIASYVYYGGTSSYVENIHSTTVSNGNWYHYCLTWEDGVALKTYINNVAVTTTTTQNKSSNTVPLYIGAIDSRGAGGGSSWNPYAWSGLIDQVRFFNSTLTNSNVDYLFNNEKQTYITKNASNPFGDSSELAFYKMENNAADSTGSNTGTVSGTTFTTTDALFGTYSASFDGSNDSIQINAFTGFTNYNFTLSIWIKTTDTLSYITSFRDPMYITFGPGLYSGGTIGMGIYDGTNPYFINNTAMQGINDGEWHHIVMTHDGINLKGYIDGSIIATVSTGTTTQSPFGTNTNRIGVRGDGNTAAAYNGLVDQLRLFNRALEGDEVFKLYAEVIN